MATLVKTGIGDGQTLTPVIITELYDLLLVISYLIISL